MLISCIEKNSTFSIFGFMIDRETIDDGGKIMNLDKLLDKSMKHLERSLDNLNDKVNRMAEKNGVKLSSKPKSWSAYQRGKAERLSKKVEKVTKEKEPFKIPAFLNPIYELFESREQMFKRLCSITNLTVTTFNAYIPNAHRNLYLIFTYEEKCYGFFKDLTVWMPSGLKLDYYMDDDVKKYYIREDDNANKVIHTFSEGKNHLAKLLKEYKTLKQQIKVKELEKDFN